MRHRALLITSLAALMALPACAEETPPRPTRAAAGEAPPRRIPPPPAISSLPAGEAVPVASVPIRVRRAVVADAARRFEVAQSEVVVARAERVTWPDGSLGCQQPGRMYTQALVPGYRLVARSARGVFVYHADTRGNLATCADASGLAPREVPRNVAPTEPVTRPPPAPQR